MRSDKFDFRFRFRASFVGHVSVILLWLYDNVNIILDNILLLILTIVHHCYINEDIYCSIHVLIIKLHQLAYTPFAFAYYTTDTCGLHPPFPHLKLGENIQGCIIIFCMLYS